jgi:Leucine-rich repeat (LRR) protein
MGRRREPTEQELRAEQTKEIDEAVAERKTELDLRTKFQDIAQRVGEITTLKKLTLKSPAFPKEIGRLTALESLSIDGNEWPVMPDEIGNLVRLEHLYAYSNAFTKLPDSFGNLERLIKAVLWQNKLTTLPRTIGKLKNLRELELKWNPLKSLPAEINGLESLTELDARSTELSALPGDLSGMRKLHRVILGEGKFKSFPRGLFTLPALVSLDLAENQIKSLPDDIGQLKTLRHLKLKQNPLETLPAALFSLPLTALNVKQCEMTELPRGVADLPLVSLGVWGNPFKDLPDEIQRLTPTDIYKHLGWKAPRTIEGDVPPPDELAKIIANHKVGFEKFVRDSRDKDRAKGLVDFFTGKKHELPGIDSDSDWHSLGNLDENVFARHAEWSFVERRVLAFMVQAWYFQYPGYDYYKGWAEQFFGWLKVQLADEGPDSSLFSAVAKEVVGQGIAEDAFLRGALRELPGSILREDKMPTSFGKYLLETAPRKLDVLGDQSDDDVREALVGLLIRNRKDLFVQIADKLMVFEPDEDGELHAPYEVLAQACSVEPARFEQLLFEAIAKTSCDHCRAEAGRVLLDNYPQHRAKALEIAKRTLAIISDRKNKQERFSFYWSGGARWSDATAAYIDWCLRTFGKVVHQDVHKLVEDTKVFDLDIAEVVASSLGQGAIDMLGEGLNMTIDSEDMAAHFRRMFALLAPLDWSKFHAKAWEIARCEFKQVRETACLALARLEPKLIRPEAKALLASKKGHEREAGVYVLSLVKDAEATKLLRGLLDTETSDDARDIIVRASFRDETSCDKAELERRVKSAKTRGKLDKPVAKWLDEKKLPKLVLAKSKTPLDADTVRFLFYRQTRQSEISLDPEARAPLGLVDRAKAGDFASKLFDLVLKNGGVMAKNRFALALVGTLGDDRVIEPLEELAVAKQNENAARTLGLLGSMEAARALDRILKAYRVKYPNMRAAAQEGFDAIADNLGLTPFELSDTMIPDFGFKAGRAKIAGTKPELFATLTSERKVAVVDNAGAIVKSPKLAATQKAELEQLGEEVRAAARQLAQNLEYYLIVRRRWTASAWKTFFATNPLAFAFATGFVWGIYRGGKPTTTFRLTATHTTVDASGAAVAVPKEAELGLVHPLELAGEQRASWLSTLAANGIVPAFPQLDRPTFAINDEERERAKSFRFEDQELAGSTFKGRAERRGWRRGSVIDSGEVSAYRKIFPHDKVEVFIATDGLNVQSGFDDGADVTLKDMFFVRPGAVVTGSYTYDEPRDECDGRLIRLVDVPPIVFSEAIADMQAITKRKDEEAEA